MADLRVQGLLRAAALGLGWSTQAAELLSDSLRKSTLVTYNRVLVRWIAFCRAAGFGFLTAPKSVFADFLLDLTSSLQRPHSALKAAQAVVNLLGELDNEQALMHRLRCSIVNTRTVRPLRTSTLVDLSAVIRGLRRCAGMEKAVAFLGFSALLRNKDISVLRCGALKCAAAHSENHTTEIDSLGFKNDPGMEGFKRRIPGNSDADLCLACALNAAGLRARPSHQLFAVDSRGEPLDSAGVGKLLREFAVSCGVTPSANWLRKVGVHAYLARGFAPHVIQQIGGWKSSDIFMRHYVQHAEAL